MNDNILHIDFETRSAVDLKAAGVHVYAEDESTDVWCMGWAVGDGPAQLWTPGWEFNLGEDTTVVAHNAAFELAIWNGVMVKKYGWPPLRAEQMLCTAAMAYAMAIPASLEKAALAVGIEHQKDMQGHKVMMQLCRPRSLDEQGNPIWWDDSAKIEKLFSYCKQDLEVERELFKRLRPLSDAERQIWILDQKINNRGIAADVESVETAIELVEFEKRRLDREMRMLTGRKVATCSSTKQLTDWVKAQGVEDVEGIAKADVLELLSREDLPPLVRQVLLLRQEAAKSSTAKLEAMRAGVCSDGRIRGTFQYHGAGTGRWAGRRIQLHNLPRGHLAPDEINGVFSILGKGKARGGNGANQTDSR